MSSGVPGAIETVVPFTSEGLFPKKEITRAEEVVALVTNAYVEAQNMQNQIVTQEDAQRYAKGMLTLPFRSSRPEDRENVVRILGRQRLPIEVVNTYLTHYYDVVVRSRPSPKPVQGVRI